MKPTSRQTSLSRASFSDIDQFTDWTQENGWEHLSLQISAGRYQVSYDHFNLPFSQIVQYQTRQKAHDVYAIPQGTVLIFVPKRMTEVVSCGTVHSCNEIAFVPGGKEFWNVLDAGLEAYEFVLDEAFAKSVGILPSVFQSPKQPKEPVFLELGESRRRQLVAQLDMVFDFARTSSGPMEGSLPASGLENFFVDGLVTTLSDNAAQERQLPTAKNRTDLAYRARALMSANAEREISMMDVAKDLGVSYRLLHLAIRETFAMTPGELLRAIKLQRVRRVLLNEDTTVTEAAVRFGLYHAGRFAHSYKQQFGEFPSETSKRRRRQV